MPEAQSFYEEQETLVVAGESNVGCVRKKNEDSWGRFTDQRSPGDVVLIVADGMGGAAAGEVASEMAVEIVREEYFRASTDTSPPDSLKRAIAAANSSIYREAVEVSNRSGMGTTCTACVIRDSHLWYGHVGDSRAYVVVGSDIRQITRDHTVAAEMQKRGGMGRGYKNVLSRCVGVREEMKVDVSDGPLTLTKGNSVVMCSDGLSNLVKDEELLFEVSMHLPQAACQRLVELARDRGAPDNVTIVIARMRGS